MQVSSLESVIAVNIKPTIDALNQYEQKLKSVAQLTDKTIKDIDVSFGKLGGSFQNLIDKMSALGSSLKSVGSASSAVKTGAAAASTEVSALATAATAAGGAIGALVGFVLTATTGFVAMAHAGGEIGGQMLDISLNTGLATEKLLLYKVAAEQSGSSVTTLTSGIERLAGKLEEAASGDKHLNAIFTALGVDAKKAAEDPAEAFDTLFTKIASIEDPLLRVKIAQEVAGKSGANLISTFTTLKEDGDALKKRMAELGLTFSKDVAKRADEVTDEFVILGAASDALKVQVAAELAPEITKAIRSIEDSLTKLRPAIVGVGKIFVASFEPAIKELEIVSGWVDKIAAKFGVSSTGAQAAAKANKDLYLKNTAGRKVDPNTGLIDLASEATDKADPYKALRDALSAKYGPKSKTPSAPLTPADTTASKKAMLDAELQLEEAFARRSSEIAKAESQLELSILKEQLDGRQISVANYYAERAKIEQAAAASEIADQERIITAERKRITEAERLATEAKARANSIDDEKLKRAKTPDQRSAIETDRANRMIIIENELAAQRDQHSAKIVAAETKITELELKRQQQAANTSREGIRANEALEASFNGLTTELLRSQGREFEAVGFELGERFEKSLAQAILAGRTDIVGVIEQITALAQNRALASESQQRFDRSSIELDIRRLEIQHDYEAGLITEEEARRRTLSAEREMRDALLDELYYQRELAEIDSDPNRVAAIDKRIEELKTLGRQTHDAFAGFAKSFEDVFASAFTNVFETGFKGMIGAMLTGWVKLLAEMEAKAVAKNIGQAILGAGAKQGQPGGLLGGLINKVGKIFGVDFGGAAAKKDDAEVIGDAVKEANRDVVQAVDRGAEAADNAAKQAGAQLGQIATSNDQMAGCACATPQGPGLLQSIIGGAIGGAFSGIGSGITGFLAGKMHGTITGVKVGNDFEEVPGKASGGDVSAGMLYRVNENGMEYFRPNRNGSIIPLGGGGGAISGGTTVIEHKPTYIINAPTPNAARETANQVAARNASLLNHVQRRDG